MKTNFIDYSDALVNIFNLLQVIKYTHIGTILLKPYNSFLYAATELVASMNVSIIFMPYKNAQYYRNTVEHTFNEPTFKEFSDLTKKVESLAFFLILGVGLMGNYL